MRPDPLRETIVCALQGVRAAGLDRVDARQLGENAKSPRVMERLDDGARQRPAPHLDERSIQAAAAPNELGHNLVAEGLSTLDGHTVVGSLAGERNRAVPDRLLQPVVRGIADNPGLARTDREPRAQLFEPRDHGAICGHGNVDIQRSLCGASDHGCGQSRVAATRNRKRRRFDIPARGQTRSLHDLKVDQDPHEVTGLVRAGDVAGFVLYPHAAVPGELQVVTEGTAPAERGHGEAAAVDARDRRVKPLDNLHVIGVGKAAGPSDMVGVEERTIAEKGVRLVPAGKRRRDGSSTIVMTWSTSSPFLACRH